MKILIAEDDAHIRNGLEMVLQREGYEVIVADNGEKALMLYQQQHPDFVILDIMMPERDGYSVCREIRKTHEHIPIVFLSAKDEEIDRVVGLELGADDYISKPFGIHEFRARIKAIARRCFQHTSEKKAESNTETASFPFGDLLVYPDKLCAQRYDTQIDLSLREIKILQCLYKHRNQAVSRDALFNAAWGYEHMPNSRTLDQHISRLRKTLEAGFDKDALIRTVHGVGYRYQEP